MEMDTDSLYFALAKNELEDYFRLEMNADWEQQSSKHWKDSVKPDPVVTIFS